MLVFGLSFVFSPPHSRCTQIKTDNSKQIM